MWQRWRPVLAWRVAGIRSAMRSRTLRTIIISVAFAALFVAVGRLTRDDALWQSGILSQAQATMPVIVTPAPTPRTAGTETLSVWVSPSGTRYHLTAACSGMKAARELVLANALIEGYTACKVCKPPE